MILEGKKEWWDSRGIYYIWQGRRRNVGMTYYSSKVGVVEVEVDVERRKIRNPICAGMSLSDI